MAAISASVGLGGLRHPIRLGATRLMSTYVREAYLHTVKEPPRPNVPPRTFHLVGLMQDRLLGNSSAQAAAEAPRQVMLEMDQARYKNALEHISTGMHLQQPNRVDIVSTVREAFENWDDLHAVSQVHGGLMLRELKASIEAAKQINAAIYLVDRPFTITKNRVAQKLLNPVTFGNFLKYGNRSLVFRKDQPNGEDIRELDAFLKQYCPGIHKVLIEERNQYMAHQIMWNSQPGETIVVVCSAMHVPGLANLLQKKLNNPSEDVSGTYSKGQYDMKYLRISLERFDVCYSLQFCRGPVSAPDELADLTKKSLPVVPFLFLFYLALPGYIMYLVGAGGLRMVLGKTKPVLGIKGDGEGAELAPKPAVKVIDAK